ncbi:branched-chain amino acid ABC transporter permease [Castellaniella sp.]|uniref:branched-chain amino acid ABC transporter permease n=1 Tax=Castellaniella sp. TaxID=1955812 RepID=UPI00356530D0
MNQIVLLSLLDGVAMSSVLFLLAVGLSLIFGVMRILNIAHGGFYAIGAYGASLLGQYLIGASGSWLNFIVLLLVAVVAGIVLGFAVEKLVLAKMYDKEHVLQILSTFAVFMILEDGQKLLFGVRPYFYDAPLVLLGTIDVAGIFYTRYQLVFLPIVALLVLASLMIFFRRTQTGKIIEAVIEDTEISSTLGINTKKIYTYTFILGTFLACLAGALASPSTSIVPGIGAEVIVLSFAIVATAGLGNFFGTALTSLIIGLAYSISVYTYSEFTNVIPYLVMALILIVKPYGLFGKKELARL